MSGRTMNKSRLGALPWIAPALIMIAVFVIWPAFEMIRTSFQIVGSTGQSKGWAGWANYQTLLLNPDLKNVNWWQGLWVFSLWWNLDLYRLRVKLLNDIKSGKLQTWDVQLQWSIFLAHKKVLTAPINLISGCFTNPNSSTFTFIRYA